MRGADGSCKCFNSVNSRVLLLYHYTQAPRQHVVCRTRTTHQRAVCMHCHHRMTCVARSTRPSRSCVGTFTGAAMSHHCVVRACTMLVCMHLCSYACNAGTNRVCVCVRRVCTAVGRPHVFPFFTVCEARAPWPSTCPVCIEAPPEA